MDNERIPFQDGAPALRASSRSTLGAAQREPLDTGSSELPTRHGEGTAENDSGSSAQVMAQPEAPNLPRPRMSLSQRAKIFIPFDPLKGYQEALRAKEREAEARMNQRVHIDDAP